MTYLHSAALFLLVVVTPFLSCDALTLPYPAFQHASFTNTRTLNTHLNSQNGTTSRLNYTISEGCRISMEAWSKNTYPNQHTMSVASGQWMDDLGLFDSCELYEPLAHHCSTVFSFENPATQLTFYYGMCIPKNCTQEDVLLIAPELMSPSAQIQYYALVLEGELKRSPQSAGCADQQSQWYDDGDAMTMVILVIILFIIVMIATILDHFLSVHGFSVQQKHAYDSQDSPAYVNLSNYADGLADHHTQQERSSVIHVPQILAWKRFIHAFSAIRNFRKLIAPIPVSSVDMSCLNGVRVLSMTWVIIGHTAYFSFNFMRDPLYLWTKLITRPSYQVVLEAFYAVDSFFFLSGFLASYFLLITMLKRPPRMKLLSGYYIHRWLRLTPIYMFWLFMFWKLTIYIGAGQSPLQFLIQGSVSLDSNGNVQYSEDTSGCGQYWWTNLLYINNFIPEHFSDECMGWAWYLANDMQFAIILPFIIFLYTRWRVAGLTLIFALLTGSITYVGTLSHDNRFTTMYIDPNNTQKYYDDIYDKPYGRIQPYLIGILYAFLLHARPQRIPTRVYRPCILLAAFLMAGLVFGPAQLYQSGGIDNWSRLTHDLYMATSRGMWAVGLGFLCYSMIVGTGEEPLLDLSQPQLKQLREPGSYLKAVLGHSIWTPLARLSYQAYLVHETWVTIFLYNLRAKPHYTDFSYVSWVLINVTMAFALSFVGFLLVEKPVMNLTNWFMSWVRGEKSSKSDE